MSRYITHTINVWYIYLHTWFIFLVNVRRRGISRIYTWILRIIFQSPVMGFSFFYFQRVSGHPFPRVIFRQIVVNLGMEGPKRCLGPPRSPLKADIPSKYPLYIYRYTSCMGTIPRVFPSFSRMRWIRCCCLLRTLSWIARWVCRNRRTSRWPKKKDEQREMPWEVLD